MCFYVLDVTILKRKMHFHYIFYLIIYWFKIYFPKRVTGRVILPVNIIGSGHFTRLF